MNRRRGLLLLFVLALALSACGRKEPEPFEGPVLWFQTSSEEAHGPALASQPYEGELQPEALLEALLAGPDQDELRSPFPKNVTVSRCGWDGERPGVLLVSLSEQYGALADISLTLADYCIVLTLSQAEGVDAVEISTQGYHASYRGHQLLSAEEAVLWDEWAESSSLPKTS